MNAPFSSAPATGPARLLVIDTATERCSVALALPGRFLERTSLVPRAHGELVLPMVREVLQEAGVALADLDCIAYGRGPGAFTGVRIAVGVVQGLAYGAALPTVGVSNLAAVAQQVARPGERVLVCMDARMGQVYWAGFELPAGERLVRALGEEQVGAPDSVAVAGYQRFAGTGFNAYESLRARVSETAAVHPDALPGAREIAELAAHQWQAGHAVPAAQAAPVYVRDQVAFVKKTSSPPP